MFGRTRYVLIHGLWYALLFCFISDSIRPWIFSGQILSILLCRYMWMIATRTRSHSSCIIRNGRAMCCVDVASQYSLNSSWTRDAYNNLCELRYLIWYWYSLNHFTGIRMFGVSMLILSGCGSMLLINVLNSTCSICHIDDSLIWELLVANKTFFFSIIWSFKRIHMFISTMWTSDFTFSICSFFFTIFPKFWCYIFWSIRSVLISINIRIILSVINICFKFF